MGVEVTGTVAKFSGRAWDANQDRLLAGGISMDEYHAAAMEMIEAFGRHLQMVKVIKKLENLRLDQIELDLLEGSVKR